MTKEQATEQTEDQAPVILARDLYKCYAGFAPVLRGASVQIMAGEMAAVMGPSGCGKSTMLHILGMLHAPDSGSLQIMGRNVLAFSREETAAFRRGNMGFVMQSSNLFEHSTVFENVEFPLIYENVPQEERWERVIRALDLVRLSSRVHYRSNRLSGGEQQRVAIARAMVNNPRILLADEPTGALDARTSRLIMENFRRLCHMGGVCMVMVTHDPKMAEYCDSIYTLEEGVLVCKKHEIPKLPANTSSFKNRLDPVVRGALVAQRFPDPERPGLLGGATRLNAQLLLSRICSLSPGGFLANPKGYALPMAIRHIGLWQRWGAMLRFFRHARSSQALWPLWRDMPDGGGFWAKARSFALASLVARFARADNIEFIFSPGALAEATTAWAAARLLRLPFAFGAPGAELAGFGPDWAVKAKDAAFIVCQSETARKKLRELMPAIEPEKFLLLRSPAPPQEEEAAMPQAPGQPLELLAVDEGRLNYKMLFAGARALKLRRIAFRLKIAGGKKMRLRARLFGLSGEVAFLGHLPQDRLGELYKNANIFLAQELPPKPGAIVEMSTSLATAMAYGCAVIAGDWPALAEIVKTGVNGVLVPAGDAAAFTNALERLANDAPLRESLGREARAAMRDLENADENDQSLARRVALAAGDAEFKNGTANE